VLARVSWLAGDTEGAKGRCLEALARWPEHAGALDLLGDCFRRSGDLTLAERAWKYAAWAEPSPEKRAEIQGKLHDLAKLPANARGGAAPSAESGARASLR
jgi:predicted negative regulator of RcsB-dependent stress response